MENDAGDTYPYDAITRKYDKPGHNMQIVCHSIEEEENGNRTNLINTGVFKPTTGNAIKRLQMRQETRVSTTNTQITEAILKLIAN